MHVTRTAFAALTVMALTAAASAKPLTLPAETNLRAAPGTKSEIVTLIPKGSEVEVGECDAGWCKVKFGDKEGFAIGRNVGEASPKEASNTATAPRARTQTGSQANLQKLRQGYEQYFDGNQRNDVTGSIDDDDYSPNAQPQQQPQQRYAQPQQQYAPPRNARPQYTPQPQYNDDYDDDEDDVVAYVPARPPVYYGYAPYPRPYYAPGPYYYRRW